MSNEPSRMHSPNSTQRHFIGSGPLKGILKHRELALEDDIQEQVIVDQENQEKQSPDNSSSSKNSFKQIQNQQSNVEKAITYRQNSNKIGRLNTVWRTKSLNVIYYITRFARQLKTSANKIKFKLLTQRILEIISDSGSDSQQVLIQRDQQFHKKSNNQRNQICQNIKQIISRIPVLEPDSHLKLTWDIIILLAIIINLIYIPLELSFDIDIDFDVSLFLNLIPSWLFVIDIFVTLQTAYYDKGTIHRDQVEIVKHYFKGGTLILDLIVVIPVLLNSLNISFLKYTLLLRLFRLPKISSNIEEIINPNQEIQALIQLFKLVYFILMTCHFCACIWAFLGQTEVDLGQNSWMIHYQIDDTDWQIKYVYSFYYSAITTLTIGYGDITPQTIPEKIYTCFLALLVCGVLGYSVSTVGQIIGQLQERTAQLKRQMSLVTNYMKSKKLNQQLQLQVRKYFEHYFKLQQKSQLEAEHLMSQLTKELKEKVAIDSYLQLLKKSKVLQHLDEECLKRLCSVVHEQKCAPEEYLWTQNEQANKLIFLIKGQLDLMANGIILKSWKKGVIGEREFASQSTYITQLKASKFTQIIYLEYQDFQLILSEKQDNLERIKMLQDNLIFNENYKTFGSVCEVCEWTHSLDQCPFVFIKINKIKVINKFKETKDMTRLFNERRIFRINPRKKLSEIQECALAMIINEKLIHQLDITDQFLQQLGFALDIEEDKNIQQKKEPTLINDSFTAKDTMHIKDSNEIKVSDSFSNDLMTYSGHLPSILPHASIPSPQISQNLNKNGSKESLVLRRLKRENSQNIEKRIQFAKQSELNLSKEFKKKSQIDSWRTIDYQNFKSNKKVSYTSQTSALGQRSVQRMSSFAASPRIKNSDSYTIGSRLSRAQYIKSLGTDDMVIIMEAAQDKPSEYCDFDLDKQFIMSIYFPIFNFDSIIKKVQIFWQMKQISLKASLKRSKTLQRLIDQ